jgi:hypothetical protein
LAKSALKAAESQRKAEANELAVRKAEIESARIRAMFDEERLKFAKRYGVVSTTSN